MSGFIPVRLNQFVEQYLRKNKDADGDTVRAAVEDALAAWRHGVRCACGNPLWVAGSAVAGYGCFTCITGSYDPLYEEEIKEEHVAVPETENQQRLVHFLNTGGPVIRQVLDAYLEERYSETSNLPLIRKYFKQANPNLKAILLNGLAANPTNLELLDDLSYFSEFDSMLGELIHFYTDACLKETDMERFSLLAQDFHMNTYDQGYDALQELTTIFQSGAKGAVIQHLSETIDDFEGPEDIPF
ncbi:MAG: hypothetical protein HGJ93_18375 [Desulfosarcina sp.]|nr:hypothetical protein [Desulfosarcina sp.]MBC2767838.1 hypothetical protein [Desulfosarcina sp.]